MAGLRFGAASLTTQEIDMPSQPQRIKQPSPGIKLGGVVKGTSPTQAQLLAKIPRKPMTPEQQLAALDRAQAQADQRVKLGQQLFQAAEARIGQHQELADQIHGEQSKLREQVQEDVAKSLQSYDQWMGQIDESFTKAVRDLDARLSRMEQEIASTQDNTHKMMAHAAALLEQTQQLLVDAFGEEVETALPEDDQTLPIMQTQDTGEATEELAADPTDAAEVIVDDEPPEEDIFAKVLRRLRDQQDDDQAVA